MLADENRIAQVGEILLTHVCETARHHVTFRTQGGFSEDEAEWTVTHDGPAVAPEELAELFTPFASNRLGSFGIELALAHRLVLLHGGRIAAENLPRVVLVSVSGYRASRRLPRAKRGVPGWGAPPAKAAGSP